MPFCLLQVQWMLLKGFQRVLKYGGCWLQHLFLSYGISSSELEATANQAGQASLKSVCHSCDCFCPDLDLNRDWGPSAEMGEWFREKRTVAGHMRHDKDYLLGLRWWSTG